MSNSIESGNNGNQVDSGWNRQMSRRKFLKGLGTLAAVGVAAKAPGLLAGPSAVPAEFTSPLPHPEEGEEAGSIDWSKIPLINNELPASGLVEVSEPLAGILDQTRLVNSPTLNLRKDGDVETVIEGLPQNTLVRILPEAEGSQKPTRDGYELSRVAQLQLEEGVETLTEVDKDGRLALDLTKPVTVDASGNISFVDPEKGTVSIPATASIVRHEERNMAMPGVALVRTSESLAQSFRPVAIGGTSNEAENAAQAAWEVKDDISPLQRAVVYAAIDEGLKPVEERTGIVNADAILGEDEEVFNLAVHAGDGYVDVITRIGDGDLNDRFLVTRVRVQEGAEMFDVKALDPRVEGSAFATFEGLVAAYGERAEELVKDVTTLQLSQEEVDELAASEKAGVFLGGTGEYGMIAPTSDEIQPAKPVRTLLISKGVSVDRHVTYERYPDQADGSADYRARVYGIDKSDFQNPQTIVIAEAKLAEYDGQMEWVAMPEEADMFTYVDTYAGVFGLDAQEVRENLSYEQKKDADGNIYMVMLHGRVPLMVHKLGAEGSEWEEATPEICGKMNERPITVFTSVDGAESYSAAEYIKTYDKFNGLAPSGSFLQRSMENYPGFVERFIEHAAERGESLRVHTSFFHQIVKQELGETATPEQVNAYVNKHIETLFDKLDPYKDKLPKIEMIYANEPKWFSNGNSDWEKSPFYSTWGQEWPVEIFVRLYQEAEKRGYDLGDQITFMHNDYGVEVDDPSGAYTKADMVREDIARTRAQIATRLGIPADEVPMVMGFQAWAAFGEEAAKRPWLVNGTQLLAMDRDQAVALLAENIRSYADVIDPSGTERPVKITEIATYSATEEEHAEYIRLWVAAIKESERADAVSFWSPLRHQSIKGGADASLFDVTKAISKDPSDPQAMVGYMPSKSYYALISELYK